MLGKHICAGILCCIVTGFGFSVYAQENGAEVSADQSTAEAESAEAPQSKSNAAGAGSQKSDSEPATRFTPTEKIGAADTVSLPVDI
jgi:hypothetical protein